MYSTYVNNYNAGLLELSSQQRFDIEFKTKVWKTKSHKPKKKTEERKISTNFSKKPKKTQKAED